jgi:hypothetical protein
MHARKTGRQADPRTRRQAVRGARVEVASRGPVALCVRRMLQSTAGRIFANLDNEKIP